MMDSPAKVSRLLLPGTLLLGKMALGHSPLLAISTTTALAALAMVEERKSSRFQMGGIAASILTITAPLAAFSAWRSVESWSRIGYGLNGLAGGSLALYFFYSSSSRADQTLALLSAISFATYKAELLPQPFALIGLGMATWAIQPFREKDYHHLAQGVALIGLAASLHGLWKSPTFEDQLAYGVGSFFHTAPLLIALRDYLNGEQSLDQSEIVHLLFPGVAVLGTLALQNYPLVEISSATALGCVLFCSGGSPSQEIGVSILAATLPYALYHTWNTSGWSRLGFGASALMSTFSSYFVFFVLGKDETPLKIALILSALSFTVYKAELLAPQLHLIGLGLAAWAIFASDRSDLQCLAQGTAMIGLGATLHGLWKSSILQEQLAYGLGSLIMLALLLKRR